MTKTEDADIGHASLNDLDESAWQTANLRLAWVFRYSVMTNVVCLFVIGILVAVINAQYPLVRTEVALVRADELEDQLIFIEPIDPNTPGQEVVIEYTLRRYLNLILPVDPNPVAEEIRLKEALYFTSTAFASKWNKVWLQSRDYFAMKEKQITRRIDVLTVSRLQRIGNRMSYNVDYAYEDRTGERIVKSGTNRLTVYLELLPREIEPEARFINLAGVFVTDLSVEGLDYETY